MKYIYCPTCGTKTEEKPIGDEGLVPFCNKCNKPLWDMFRTCIITAVINEKQEIALLKQDYVSKTNHVLVAGIIKPRETAEETVIREVKEELNLDVKQLEYINSYVYDKKEMLMLAYKALVEKKDFILSQEVNEAEWISLNEAHNYLREESIAWQLVKKIKKMGK